MTFVKGYKQSKRHKENLKESRKRFGFGTCKYCEQIFEKYHPDQTNCNVNVCKKKCDRDRYYSLAEKDPIGYKAQTLFGGIRLGRGKKKISRELLADALDKPCGYCGHTITIENASVDHKEPRIYSKVYNRKTKKMTYTKEELEEIDRLDNLHIICNSCNALKNDFSHDEFIKVLEFIKKNPKSGEKLKKRLAHSIVLYSKH